MKNDLPPLWLHHCPGHCSRYSNVRANSYIVYDTKEEEVIIDAKKQAFEEGQKNLSYSNRPQIIDYD